MTTPVAPASIESGVGGPTGAPSNASASPAVNKRHGSPPSARAVETGAAVAADDAVDVGGATVAGADVTTALDSVSATDVVKTVDAGACVSGSVVGELFEAGAGAAVDARVAAVLAESLPHAEKTSTASAKRGQPTREALLWIIASTSVPSVVGVQMIVDLATQ